MEQTDRASAFSPRLMQLAEAAQAQAKECFSDFDRVAESCTARVLSAFKRHRVSAACFDGTTGYGYGDLGREKLELAFADIFGAEKALVRIQLVNGTHAIACALFACLKTGDVLLSATGGVYDTLRTVTGQNGAVGGTFQDYGIGYREVALKDGAPDLAAIEEAAAGTRAVYIQRSRGYGQRRALTVEDIGEVCRAVRKHNPEAYIVVDNCYGEFCEETEPLEAGADLICGSLIKNPGGGLAPAGGYVAGKAELVDRAACRLTVPGIGGECGATLGVNRLLFQGLFLAPHTVAQARKTAEFCACLLSRMGFSVSPAPGEARPDIIQTVGFGAPEPLLKFCRGIQAGSPIDAFATPEPWDMPGYDCPVVMAAGAFVQGSSLELSCDAPMRPPYLAYLQGGLTWEAGKWGILSGAGALWGEG